jgi:hypothetical protein
MATALRHLPQQRRPSEVVVPGLLDGLESVERLARGWLARRTFDQGPAVTALKGRRR